MGDCASQKRLETGFAHFVDPKSTTLDVLGSIKHLMSIHEEGSDEYKALQQIAKAESANVTAGAIALQSSPLLQEKLGTPGKKIPSCSGRPLLHRAFRVCSFAAPRLFGVCRAGPCCRGVARGVCLAGSKAGVVFGGGAASVRVRA